MLLLTFSRRRPRASAQARTAHNQQTAIAQTFQDLAALVGPAGIDAQPRGLSAAEHAVLTYLFQKITAAVLADAQTTGGAR